MDSYYKAINDLEKSISSELFHYCSADKFKYLLDPYADLSLRNLSYQADGLEFRFGAQLLCENIRSCGGRYCDAADIIEANLTYAVGTICEKLPSFNIPCTLSLTDQANSEYHYKEYSKCDGGAIVFNQQRLMSACELACKNGVSMRLIRCYYAGKNSRAISRLYEAFWDDQKGNIDRLIESDYQDENAGKRILSEICAIASHIKKGSLNQDDEWRLLMVSDRRDAYDPQGFRPSGLRYLMPNQDLIELFDGVVISHKESYQHCMQELSRFALQLRKKDFKVWSL